MSDNTSASQVKQSTHVKWDRRLEKNYVDEIDNEAIAVLEQDLDMLLANPDTVSTDEVNNLVRNVNSLLLDSADKLNMVQKKSKVVKTKC